jgi:hypothetical protein
MLLLAFLRLLPFHSSHQTTKAATITEFSLIQRIFFSLLLLLPPIGSKKGLPFYTTFIIHRIPTEAALDSSTCRRRRRREQFLPVAAAVGGGEIEFEEDWRFSFSSWRARRNDGCQKNVRVAV